MAVLVAGVMLVIAYSWYRRRREESGALELPDTASPGDRPA
jgi:hypothetical protein